MAKRMASSIDAQKTSNKTRPRRKTRMSLPSMSMGLAVVAMAGKGKRSPVQGRCPSWFILRRQESLVLPPAIGDGGAHEFHPDGQGGLCAGFLWPQRLLLVKAHPHPAGDAGRKTDEPRVSEIIGGPGLAGQRVVQLARGRGCAVLDYALEQRDHGAGRARAHHVARVGKILFEHVTFVVSNSANVTRLDV